MPERITLVRAMVAATALVVTPGHAADPLASNNGLYPEAADYDGPFNIANLAYPKQLPEAPLWSSPAPLTVASAPAYAAGLKKLLDEDLRILINDAASWDPVAAGWYDLVWQGEGSPGPGGATDPTSGREAVMNTYTGQILPPEAFAAPYTPTVSVQNHAVIYYNAYAAKALGDVFADIYDPRITGFAFPEGSVVLKVEAATPTPDEWPVLDGTSTWTVFRPTVAAQQAGPPPYQAEVLETRPIQVSMRIKDSAASPLTGWVFAGFVYDRRAEGQTPWDRFVPLGLQWGNDPEYATLPDGRPADGALAETWVNPDAPAFVHSTLGWGGRLAGPMDVATRHNVITTDGTRYPPEVGFPASSCQSCHSAAEFPFTVNLYPSPNRSFPQDKVAPFLLHVPGSAPWAEWFQNRPGTTPFSDNIGGHALDYDMALMFALGSAAAATGNMQFALPEFDVH